MLCATLTTQTTTDGKPHRLVSVHIHEKEQVYSVSIGSLQEQGVYDDSDDTYVLLTDQKGAA